MKKIWDEKHDGTSHHGRMFFARYRTAERNASWNLINNVSGITGAMMHAALADARLMLGSV